MSKSVLAVFVACGVIGAAASLSACGAVLGFESFSPLEGEGGAGVDGGGTTDGSTDGNPSNIDGGGDGSTACVADLTKDPKHCGRCNHDCLGGTCEASVCQPIKLADGLADAEGLVVDDKDVYVAERDQNRIIKFGKNTLSGCQTPPLPGSCVFNTNGNAFKPSAMGIDATRVYWTQAPGGLGSQDIRSCLKTGCGGNAPLQVAEVPDQGFSHLNNEILPLELIVKDDRVFWPESLGGAIRSVSVTGGAITTHLSSSSYAPLAIAVDATHIYFTDDTNQHGTQIASVPRDASGTVTTVAETPARPFGIGLGAASTLFWTVPFITEDDDGLVQKALTSAAGGPGQGFVNDLNDPHVLMADQVNVYWTIPGRRDSSNGFVLYCPQKGCPAEGPIVIARDQRSPRHLTQDDTAIYWANEGVITSPTFNGQVFKVAKP